jgi:hypothetical protein
MNAARTRTRRALIAVAMVAALAAAFPSAAQRQGTTQWAANAPGSNCKVWGPSMLISAGGDQSDYLVRYQGSCRNGVANGQGTATWLYRWAEGKVHSTWTGTFIDGIFVGKQPIRAVTGLPGDRFLVPLQGHALRVLLLSRSEQTGALDLCKIEKVLVDAGAGADALVLDDDDVAKEALLKAAAAARSQCPQAGRLSLEIHAAPVAPDANGRIQNPLVTAVVSDGGNTLANYSNRASDAQRRAAQTARRADRDLASRTRFIDFSRRHGLSTWVLASQVDKNPFLFGGQRVGVLVQLVQMRSPTQAVVRDLRERGAPNLLLTGITPETFRSDQAVVAATVAPTRAALEAGYPAEISELQAIEAVPCAERLCTEWTGWMAADDTVQWGRPMRWNP